MKLSLLFLSLGSFFQLSVCGQNFTPTVINGVSVPMDFPFLNSNVVETTAPGYIWVNAYGSKGYNIIFKNDGTPVFYRIHDIVSRDFKLHPNGLISTYTLAGYHIYDMNMNLLHTVNAQNGYRTDDHELFIAPNGNYLVIASGEKMFDLSHLPGGRTDTEVGGNHVQELDGDLNVVFEWNCWDLFEIDGTQVDIGQAHVDYIHMNSISVDYDGHILTSSRHLSECTKLHRTSGEIIWRLGGKYNQFEFAEDDVEFSYQHTFMPVEGKPNHYTLFDNGSLRDPSFSRAVEYKLDTINMKADKIWEYPSDESKFSWSEGGAQRLPNGNTLINFVCGPDMLVEVTEAGEVVYEAGYEDNCTYRAFRYDWEGMVEAPYFVIDNYPGEVHLIFNKFGDDSISYYNVYADTISNPTNLLATTTDTWYIPVNLEPAMYYFKISAVNSKGEESDFSDIKSATISTFENNVDLIKNGDFKNGTDFWGLTLESGAFADWSITEDNYIYIDIGQKGEHVTNIQLIQEGITLYKGVKYILSFNADVEAPRIIEARISKVGSSWTDYSKFGFTPLKEGLHNYEYDFMMQESTDINSRMVFNLGGNEGDVKLGNIKLIQVLSLGNSESISNSGVNKFETVSYPVPFSGQLNIKCKIPNAEDMQAMLYDVSGRLMLKSKSETSLAEEQMISLNTVGLKPGIYFYQLEFNQNNIRMKTRLNKVIKVQY